MINKKRSKKLNIIIYFTFTFILIILYSCNNNKDKIDYYSGGEIRSVCETFGGKKNGKLIEYYKNGVIKSLKFYLNDTLVGVENCFYPSGKYSAIRFFNKGKVNGIGIDYFENGKIKEIGHYKNDNQIGEWKYYSITGSLTTKRNYVEIAIKEGIIKGIVNEVIYFDELKDTIKNKSNYFLYETKNDTINYGEPYNAKIKLESPYYKENLFVIFGDFDEFFTPLDSSRIEKIDVDNFELEFVRLPNGYKIGENIIRGIIVEYSKTKNKERRYFFCKKFFVKGNIKEKV